VGSFNRGSDMTAAAAAAANAANAAAAAAAAAAAVVMAAASTSRADEAGPPPPPRLAFRLPMAGSGAPSPMLSDLHSRISQLAAPSRDSVGGGTATATATGTITSSGSSGSGNGGGGGLGSERVGKADAAVGSGLQVRVKP